MVLGSFVLGPEFRVFDRLYVFGVAREHVRSSADDDETTSSFISSVVFSHTEFPAVDYMHHAHPECFILCIGVMLVHVSGTLA